MQGRQSEIEHQDIEWLSHTMDTSVLSDGQFNNSFFEETI